MKVITASCPDHALQSALNELSLSNVHSESRNGPVLRFPTPVTTVWEDPTKRILWSPTRDCNHFLHFIEAAWMLAGRNDVETVAYLAPNMKNYSDDGRTLYGAYGYRWREHFGFDQIDAIIDELVVNPTSRRCVLQMWDGHEELHKATSGGKDVCCNHVIAFDVCNGKLNMTVSNRSNDMIWGAYGANVVHMSILHEYIACQAELKLGAYYQMSNNLHLYLDLSPVMTKMGTYEDGNFRPAQVDTVLDADHKQEALFDSSFPLADSEFVAELNTMFEIFNEKSLITTEYRAHYLQTLKNMMNAFTVYKVRSARDAVNFLTETEHHSYWYKAAIEWLMRRPSYVQKAA